MLRGNYKRVLIYTLEWDICHVNATCHNNDGSYTCECKDNFDGDGIQKSDPTEECDPACDFHDLTFVLSNSK